jgi:hypothetical protein
MQRSERTVAEMVELAIANLRKRFPRCSIVRELDKLKPARCREKACPFPIFDQERGLCRGHLIDSVAERSVLPSALAAVIAPARQPAAHRRSS